MRIPFISAVVAYLLNGTKAVTFNERKTGDLDRVSTAFDNMREGKSGSLSKLNSECIDLQDQFEINSVKQTNRKAAAEAYADRIDFSTNGLRSTDLSINDLLRHESVHSVMRIINEKFNYQGDKPGLPYTNKEEKVKYKNAVLDFQRNLDKLETELVESLRSGQKLGKKTARIVDKMLYPKEIIMPRDPILESMPIGVPSFSISVHDSLSNFQVKITEAPKRVVTSDGQKALSLSLQNVDKTANALSLITKYKKAFSVVPKGNIDVEQPAYMIHYLEPVIEDISKPMMDYMKERILKCSGTVSKPEAAKVSESRNTQTAITPDL